MVSGKFITLEGIEGAGKTTALQFMKDYFLKLNIEPHWTREPGGTHFAEEIRRMILEPLNLEEINHDTELLLMFAARSQLVKSLRPLLDAGKWVVSDRFIDAAYAYQGGGRKIDMNRIKMLDEWIVGPTYPNLTLLFDLSPEQGFSRAEKRGTEKDRIEKEKIEFFARVRDVYLQRAKQDPDRIKIIDASAPLFAVESQLRETLDNFMKNK